MKNSKKFLVITSILALSATTLIGCASTSESITPPTQTETESAASDDNTNKTDSTNDITTEISVPTYDREGNAITVPSELNRIISTAPSNTEILVELGVGDRIIGIDKWSDDIEGLADDLALIDFQNPDAEALLSMEPDIIIASGHNRAGNDDPFALLKEAGICVVYIPTSNSIEGIYEDIEFLGALTGTTDKALEITREMQARVAAIEEIASTVEEPKTVYFEISPVPYMMGAGGESFIDDMIHTAGAINIFASETAWFSPSAEAIFMENPDVIITNADYMEEAVAEIKSREGWEELDAVANDQVYLIDANSSSRASHLAIDALEEISRLIYPELYE